MLIFKYPNYFSQPLLFMNLENLFKNFYRSPPPKEKIDIQNNSKSILYKDPQIEKPIIQPIIKTKSQFKETQLSNKTISPNRDQNTYINQRSKQNILRQFQNYIIYNKILGEGSFSRVYLGESKKSKKLIAIKQVQKLQQNEIACLMNSDSPYIIRLYDFWSFDKFSYIALQFCEGNLREKLQKTSIEERISYFEQIIEGMNYLNKKNIIHRDLKFQNILLKNNTIKISDFGLAKPIGSKLAVFSEKCGTPYTMAPQIYFHQGQGKPVYSQKCDIYSLGVIIHQMLYNRHPFDYSAQKMKNNQRVHPIKKFGVLDVLIDRCLQQQVVRRCNWNEFMQIFTLFKMKKPQHNLNILQQRNKKILQFSHQHPQNYKKPQKNHIQNHKKNIYETPTKNQAEKQNIKQKQKQNPFQKIKLPHLRNNSKKVQGRKPFQDFQTKTQKKQNFVERKMREQAWKIEHDQYFQNKPEKERQMEDETISAVKLIFLVITVLSLLVLFQKQFQ